MEALRLQVTLECVDNTFCLFAVYAHARRHRLCIRCSCQGSSMSSLYSSFGPELVDIVSVFLVRVLEFVDLVLLYSLSARLSAFAVNVPTDACTTDTAVFL